MRFLVPTGAVAAEFELRQNDFLSLDSFATRQGTCAPKTKLDYMNTIAFLQMDVIKRFLYKRK